MIRPEMFLEFDLEKKSMRDAYGDALAELGARNRNIVALCADLSESTRFKKFAEKFPNRYFECGVSEQNMIGVASGLALSGKIPFAGSFGVFSPGLNLAQIRLNVCYNNANVKLLSTHCGITTGQDGATHQALEDIAVTRSLPNMTVIVPCDYEETMKAIHAVSKIKSPCYMRVGRDKYPNFTTKKTLFEIGKANVFMEGSDCCIIACGIMVYEAIMAAIELQKIGVQCTVINCHTVKPIDAKTITLWARRTGAVVTAEEHSIIGGLGSAVAEVLSENFPVPIHRVGIKDTFGESGKPEELVKKYGITKENIIGAVSLVIKEKNKII
jgi:transketolase